MTTTKLIIGKDAYHLTESQLDEFMDSDYERIEDWFEDKKNTQQGTTTKPTE